MPKDLRREDELVPVGRAAEELGVTPAAVHNLFRRGRLANVKVGGGRRVFRGDLDRIKAEREEERRMVEELDPAGEIAEYLGYSTDHVYDLARRGELPSYRTPSGRVMFDKGEIAAHLRRRSQRGATMERRGRPRKGEAPEL